MLDWPNFTSLSGRTGNILNQHLFYVKKSSTQQIKIIPASRAVTTAGARRFAPSKSILIRLEEFRRIEARHSETTFEAKRFQTSLEQRSGHLIRPNFHSLLDGHVKPNKRSTSFLADKIYLYMYEL